jgi:fructoselysine-6-P-deglycase FrlB-like protein
MSAIDDEITSQPETWRRAAALAATVFDALPAPGVRLMVIGCGTSFHIARAFAGLREPDGGETDAFAASEMPAGRDYPSLLAISRSGTTTEVLRALRGPAGRVPSTVITAVPGSPVAEAATRSVAMEFADERSVVQTRFATTALALLRAHLGHDLGPVIAQAEAALATPLPPDPARFARIHLLGRGWTVGLADEAALKLREPARAWAEAYPALEYRHGPMALADEDTLVCAMGEVDRDVLDEAADAGATVIDTEWDAMATLVLMQRLAVALAVARGLDPDHPRNLTRSVIL